MFCPYADKLIRQCSCGFPDGLMALLFEPDGVGIPATLRGGGGLVQSVLFMLDLVPACACLALNG